MSLSIESNIRQCWVCYGNSKEDSIREKWIRPCLCRGGLEWVHYKCIHRLIDEKQRGDWTVKVSCSVCNFSYVLLYPPQDSASKIFDYIESLQNKISPYIIGVLIASSVYWSATTFGAITLLQVLGHREGMAFMECADPLMLLFGLPTIPFMLILSRTICWQNFLLRVWRRYNRFLPLSQYFLPKDVSLDRLEMAMNCRYFYGSSNNMLSNFPRYLIGGIFLPSIATSVGRIAFPSVRSNFRRTVFGLLFYLSVKGIFNIYYEENKFLRFCRRELKPFPDQNSGYNSCSDSESQT